MFSCSQIAEYLFFSRFTSGISISSLLSPICCDRTQRVFMMNSALNCSVSFSFLLPPHPLAPNLGPSLPCPPLSHMAPRPLGQLHVVWQDNISPDILKIFSFIWDSLQSALIRVIKQWMLQSGLFSFSRGVNWGRGQLSVVIQQRRCATIKSQYLMPQHTVLWGIGSHLSSKLCALLSAPVSPTKAPRSLGNWRSCSSPPLGSLHRALQAN